MTSLTPPSQVASAHGMAFVPRELVTIQVRQMSASVYPKVEPTMPIYELAHAYQVIKSMLESLPVNMHLILEAIGMQLNCNAIVDGAMFDFCSLFHKAWFDFGNLVIQSFHNSAGMVINNTTVADNPSDLLPVINSPLNTCRHQDVGYMHVSCTVDYAWLITVPGPTVLSVAFYIELPQTTRMMVNGVGGNYNLTSWLGAADLSTLSCAEVCKNILEPCLCDGPILLSVVDFNLAKANVNAKMICDTIQAKILNSSKFAPPSSSNSALGTAINPMQLWSTFANQRQAPMARW
jgi:hypothetical protein